jgi:hypothetical protein
MSSAPTEATLLRQPSLSPLRVLFAACGLIIGWLTADLLIDIFYSDGRNLRLLTAYLLPLFGAGLLAAVWRFALWGTGSVNPVLLVAGALFLTTAAILDLFVTVKHDPYLMLEANPYIRVLLDETTHPLGFVYAFVALSQAMFVATFVTAWWAFLRHRSQIVASVQSAAPQNWLAFIKAASGGGRLTYRQWLLPIRPHEIPNPYHSVWPAALAVSFGTSLFRYWAAAEWLGYVTPLISLRIAVISFGIGGTLALYYAWLAWQWRRDVPRSKVA